MESANPSVILAEEPNDKWEASVLMKRYMCIFFFILLAISCSATAEGFGDRAKRTDELYKAGDYKGVVEYLSDISAGEIPDDYRATRVQYYESNVRVAQALIKANTPLEAYPYLLAAQKYAKAKEILQEYMYRMLGTWVTASGERYAFFIDGSCIIKDELLFFSAPSSRIMVGQSKGFMMNRYTFLNSTDKTLRLRVVDSDDVINLTRVKAAEYSPSEEDKANLKPVETAAKATKAPVFELEPDLEDEDWGDEGWGDDYDAEEIQGQRFFDQVNVYPGMFDNGGEVIYATLNQQMPTRTGPGTKFTEDHGTLPEDTEVVAYTQEEMGGTSWVLVEFVKNNKLVRAYTGLKRVDADETIPQAGYNPITAIVTRETPANYGPGTAYLTVPNPVAAGTEVLVYCVDSEYAFIEYAISADQWMRSWVPESSIEYTGTTDTSQQEQDASSYTQKVTLIMNSTVNIRSGPGTDYPQIGEAFPGASFYYTGITQGDFYQILYPDINDSAAFTSQDANDSVGFSRTAYVKKSLASISKIGSQDVIFSAMVGNLRIKQGAEIYLDANLSRVSKNTLTDYSSVPFAGISPTGAYAILFSRVNDKGEAVLWIGYISANDVQNE